MTTREIGKKFGFVGIGAIVVVAVAAFLYFGATQKAMATDQVAATEKKADPETDAPEKVPVEVAVSNVGSVSAYLSATANLVPEDQVDVLCESEGRVIEVRVDEGDRVAKGDTLAVLDRAEAEIALSKARLKSANATSAYERGQQAIDEGLISREEFDRLELEHQVASEELAEAEHRLSKTTIRAPFSGRVTARSVTVGAHLHPGDTVFTVADFDPLIARVYVPEREAMSLEVGRTVAIASATDPDITLAGRIRQISPVVDTATGTVKVTVEAISPPPVIRPGAFVTVKIVRETRDAVVLLPRDAVIRELESAHVFVAEDGVAHKRAVKVGLEENGQVEIVDGVSAGEPVVVAGQGNLKDGTEVEILDA